MAVDVKHRKGREYVSAKEFARRMNSTTMTISRYIKAGYITGVTLVKGSSVRYFDWEEQKKGFLAARANAKKGTLRESRPIPQNVYMNINASDPTSPSVSEPEVKAPSVDDVISGRTSLDSIRGLINPDEEEDCWVIDIKTGARVFSWEVCEKKYRAIILSMKARQQAGELIEKKAIAPALDAFGTVLSAALNTSKFKMVPLIIAWAETLGASIKPEDEIYLKENIIDAEYTRMTDDMRSEVEKESKAFTEDIQEEKADELDS